MNFPGEIQLSEALDRLPPTSYARTQSEKKAYSEKMSHTLASAIAVIFANAGLPEMRPSITLDGKVAGQERRMSGGIGAKKVDVTCATAESGLIFAASIKTINWRDSRSGSFQKNLTNRRGDLLFESVTLHRRFPYAVLFGFFLLDTEAVNDGSARRESTFSNAHQRLQLFTGREDPLGREEQYEKLYIELVNADPSGSSLNLDEAGDVANVVSFEDVVAAAIDLVTLRNPDEFVAREQKLYKISS